jgi:beta-lactamase class A
MGFIEDIEAECGGELRLMIQDLNNSQILAEYNADTPCKTASVIKFPLLVHVALAVQCGDLRWDETLTLTDGEKVGGSGVLTNMTAGLHLTLRDACVLTTIISDNTATNMVIEHVGVAPVNQTLRDLGLPLTTLYRKAYSPDTPESKQYGLGMTTPREMCRLISLLHHGEIGNEETSADILSIMEAQRYRDGLPRYLPADWTYQGKTGAIDHVRNDVARITAPDGRAFACAIFVQNLPQVLWTADNLGYLAIARLAQYFLLPCE